MVFQAFADPRQLALWWGPKGFSNTIQAFDLRPGGRWRLVMHGPDGANYENESEFVEVSRARIVFRHLEPIHRFQMTMTFTEHCGQTQLTWRMLFESAEEVTKLKNFIAQANEQNFDRLEAHLAQRPSQVITNPSSADAKDQDFVISRVFDAPRALVWRTWTEPKQLARWWGPKAVTNPVCQLDVRPGGAHRIVMRMPDGIEYPISGVYREVVPPERLVMTMDCAEHPEAWHDQIKPNRGPGEKNPAGVLLQTITFEDLGGKTKLTVRTKFQSLAIRDAMLKMGMNEGWSQSLDRLSTLLAEGV
jgi:uncharacterized protein YndB with AHSA1/START domain